jgi:hypothetical protein
MDEMRALGIEPDDRTFLLLFRSCAEVRNSTVLTKKLLHKLSFLAHVFWCILFTDRNFGPYHELLLTEKMSLHYVTITTFTVTLR